MSDFRQTGAGARVRLAGVETTHAGLDGDRCYRAVQSRDARFDGWFVGAVTSTGIYCRPSCPVRTPRRSNMRFYPTAATAQQAGFRACKRCRPDASPGSPEWDPRADVVSRAMRLIADGIVDRGGVEGLAERLGYSVRQVERLLRQEVGTGPLALARAQRARTARTLIESSDLPFAEVCHAAGFSSIRQFNATVREVYDLAPRELRARSRRNATARTDSLSLRLALRPPFDSDTLFDRLAASAVPGVERADVDVDGSRAHHRTLRLSHGDAVVSLRPCTDHVAVELRLADLRDLTSAVARCRWLLDLDADPVATDAVLAADPAFADRVATAPGMRVGRCVDGSEMAVRVVLAQQVSSAAARTHAERLVAAVGRSTTLGGQSGLPGLLFPTPGELVDLLASDDGTVALPARRRATLASLVGALAGDSIDLGPGADRGRARHRLLALAGIGPWTVDVIAMRALGDPDVLPATDLVIRRGAARLGLPVDTTALLERSQRWRPWRSVAAQHLWAAGAGQRSQEREVADGDVEDELTERTGTARRTGAPR